MTVVLLVTSAAVAAVAAGASASAAPTGAHAGAHGTATAPAKVKAGSLWTLTPKGAPCEVDSFATGRAFSAVGGASGDHGRYKGKTKLTMTWTAGSSSGHVFKGSWNKGTGIYAGTDAGGGQSVSATLAPLSTGGCAVVTTAPNSQSVTLGSSDADVASVAGEGGVTPTGSVAFYVCPGSSQPCAPTAAGAVDLGTVGLSGSGSLAVASGPAFIAPAAGVYCFVAVYSGGGIYPGGSDGSTVHECFTVTAATAVVTTAPASPSVTLGTSDSDTATVTGTHGITPTGSVHFYECAGNALPCTAGRAATGGTDLGTSPLSGSAGSATATSAPFTASTTGTYCFVGVYAGDNNYGQASDGSTSDECFTVTAAGPPSLTVSTTPTSALISQGSPDSDNATVTGSGGVVPTGSVTFYLCGPNPNPIACTVATGTKVGSAVTPTPGSGSKATATSATVNPVPLGNYCFLGVYSGDGHYASASDGSTTDECFQVWIGHP